MNVQVWYPCHAERSYTVTFVVLFGALFAALALLYYVRTNSNSNEISRKSVERPLEVLNNRLVEGSINHEDYKEIRKLLEG